MCDMRCAKIKFVLYCFGFCVTIFSYTCLNHKSKITSKDRSQPEFLCCSCTLPGPPPLLPILWLGVFSCPFRKDFIFVLIDENQKNTKVILVIIE